MKTFSSCLQSCEVKNSTRMECRSPAISISGSERIDHENGMHLDYGFLMDHVQSVRDLNKDKNFPPFRVFPDPLYHPFEDPNSVSFPSKWGCHDSLPISASAFHDCVWFANTAVLLWYC